MIIAGLFIILAAALFLPFWKKGRGGTGDFSLRHGLPGRYHHLAMERRPGRRSLKRTDKDISAAVFIRRIPF